MKNKRGKRLALYGIVHGGRKGVKVRRLTSYYLQGRRWHKVKRRPDLIDQD